MLVERGIANRIQRPRIDLLLFLAACRGDFGLVFFSLNARPHFLLQRLIPRLCLLLLAHMFGLKGFELQFMIGDDGSQGFVGEECAWEGSGLAFGQPSFSDIVLG